MPLHEVVKSGWISAKVLLTDGVAGIPSDKIGGFLLIKFGYEPLEDPTMLLLSEKENSPMAEVVQGIKRVSANSILRNHGSVTEDILGTWELVFVEGKGKSRAPRADVLLLWNSSIDFAVQTLSRNQLVRLHVPMGHVRYKMQRAVR